MRGGEGEAPGLRLVAAERPVLITGGAGFLGANLADRLARQGRQVRILDSLARPGVEANLEWLRACHRGRIRHRIADIRDMEAVREAVAGTSAVLHLAAQVAVTTSLEDPIGDFEVNARGTLNLLEALRALPEPPPLLFASTNKVYGKLMGPDELVREGRRWQPRDAARRPGCDEAIPIVI
jgi:CDP-paratose 2-epimerase